MDGYSRTREVEKPIPTAIWKFDLSLSGVTVLRMPAGSRLLAVGVQRRETDTEVPVLWARVRTDRVTPVTRHVLVYPTGVPVGEIGAFIGTFQINEGEYVGHVFDLGEDVKTGA
jgi:hypothetical protein